MNNKHYPETLFNEDVDKVKTMNISPEEKLEKTLALANIYFNQDNEKMIDPFSIGDMRENILKEV
jgi:hypothetical protein